MEPIETSSTKRAERRSIEPLSPPKRVLGVDQSDSPALPASTPTAAAEAARAPSPTTAVAAHALARRGTAKISVATAARANKV